MKKNSINERILYEDNHLIIVNKLPGEIVQGDKTGDFPLVEEVREYIKEKYNKPGNVFCGLVHRIDRPVGGAVIFAKTSKALARMNEMVKNRLIRKIYWVLVEGCPEREQDTLTHYLRKNEKLNKSFCVDEQTEDARKAVLSYRMIEKYDRYSLLEVELHTGRHHQIRAQLAAIGHCIKGDLKYGAKRSNPDGSISLQAHRLIFEHPVSHLMMDVTADDLTKPKLSV
jgi:23S rRNA pseudouridine1911/1915/1917 synthase